MVVISYLEAPDTEDGPGRVVDLCGLDNGLFYGAGAGEIDAGCVGGCD